MFCYISTMLIKIKLLSSCFRRNKLKYKNSLNSFEHFFTKFTKAIEELLISFLPFMILATILGIFNVTGIPRADYPFLVATLFTDATWKCKDLVARSPSEKSCGILFGVVGALLSTIAAILLLLVELNIINPIWIPHIYERSMLITFWGFITAIIYSVYIRYRVS